MADGMPGWLRRFAGAFPPRAMRLLVTVTAGLMMCISFPPIGWWWSAVLSFALLSWVLVHPRTTLAGAFGYYTALILGTLGVDIAWWLPAACPSGGANAKQPSL